MSCYLLKNYKIVKTENGYNISGEIADSSISDYNYNYVYEHSDRIFKEDSETKEQLERKLFELFLDGELKGAVGKFKVLDWNNGNQEALLNNMTNREKAVKLLEKLDKSRWNNNLTNERKNQLDDRYNKVRYNLYYKAWQRYLYSQDCFQYVVVYTRVGEKPQYVTKLTNKHIWANEDKRQARIFKGNYKDNKNVMALLTYMTGYGIQPLLKGEVDMLRSVKK